MAASSAISIRSAALVAARGLVARHGHRDVSMRDIARDVGCSVSTLYFHFENRDAIVHALIEEGFERWYAELCAMRETASSPVALLEAIARGYVAFGLENPEQYEIMFMFHPRSMERLPRELFRRIRRSLDLTAEAVRDVARESGCAASDHHALAAAIWATLHGVVSTLLTERLDTRIDRAHYVECAVHSVLVTATAGAPALALALS